MVSEEILRRLRDEPNWNPSFGPGGLSRQEAKVWHQTCVLAADEIERLSAENSRLTDENINLAHAVDAEADRVDELTGLTPRHWQPIKSAPKDGTPVLMFATRGQMLNPDREILVAEYHRGWWSGRDVVTHATHWMPLPAAPVSGRQES